MLVKGNRFHFVRGQSTSRRAMLFACGAVSSAAMLSFMTAGAHAQALNTWTSSTSGNWSNGANWLGGSPPTVSGTHDTDLEFNASGTYTSNNDIADGFPVYDTTFDAGNGTTNLTGGTLDLGWPFSEPNMPSFANNSTNPVTINNNINYDAGDGTQEHFVLAQGSTTTFTGSMTLTGGDQLVMQNDFPVGTNAAGGTMIWTQPQTITSGYFPIRIKEGTFEMAGLTVQDGSSDGPVVTVPSMNGGINTLPTGGGVNNGANSSLFLGPDDSQTGGGGPGSLDSVSFYLLAAGDSLNWGPEIGNPASFTIGGLNTTGTVTFNNYFHGVNHTDQNGIGQTYFYSEPLGGTALQNFQLIGGDHANIDKIGGGTWIIDAGGINPSAFDGQAYSGNTIVRDGTLELAYDDTGTNNVTFPATGLPSFYMSGADGGSLGFNAATNAVQLGEVGTLATDNIALLTLIGGGGPRQVLHNINVNNFNPNGTTSIGVGDSGVGNFFGNILLNENVVLASGTGGTANFSGVFSGVGGINTSGTGTINLSGVNSYGGSTSVASGSTLAATITGALPSGTHVTNNGALIINGNANLGSLNGTGTLSLSPAPGMTKVTLATNSGLATEGGLTIAANSVLDITNNHMIINYAAGTQATVDSTVRGYLISGYNGGAFNGTTGITSSTAAANSGFAVGYADGADGVVAGLSSGQIELKYTLYGDANLDGLVSGVDFTILVGNLGKSENAWDKGDFNYDGVVSGIDFTLLVGNLGKAANGADVTLPAADLAAIDAFAAANGLMSSVPEPTTAGLLLAAGVGMLARRRRNLHAESRSIA